MALYAGEAVRVRAELIDPDTEEPLVIPQGDNDPTATIELWSPTQGDPSRNVAIRDTPDHGPAAMEAYRAETSDFIVYVSTEGDGIAESATPGEPWEPGRWSYRVSVTGDAFTNWEYGNFTLKE